MKVLNMENKNISATYKIRTFLVKQGKIKASKSEKQKKTKIPRGKLSARLTKWHKKGSEPDQKYQ